MFPLHWLLPTLLAAGSFGPAQFRAFPATDLPPTVALASPAPDSPGPTAAEEPAPEPVPPPNPQPPQPPDQPSRDVSFSIKSFARNFFSDQKKIWTFPARLATGHDVLPVLAIFAGTAVVVAAADPYEGRYFRTHANTFDGFNDVLSEHRTTASTLAGPGILCGIGLIARKSYLAHTGLLALEAWVDVDITAEVMRNIADRRRPLDVPLNGNYRDTWFQTASSPLHADGSFPSGHTGWGFAVATVIARRYPKRPWVRYLAYSLAGVDLASRLTSSNHFLSDSLFGAALGYSIGRFVVLRQ